MGPVSTTRVWAKAAETGASLPHPTMATTPAANPAIRTIRCIAPSNDDTGSIYAKPRPGSTDVECRVSDSRSFLLLPPDRIYSARMSTENEVRRPFSTEHEQGRVEANWTWESFLSRYAPLLFRLTGLYARTHDDRMDLFLHLC